MNRTLTIIKPDAFNAGKAGKIIAHLENAGFKVIAARVMHLSTAQAQAFYEVHKERPFYGSLVSFMTSGTCMPNGNSCAWAGAGRRGAASTRPVNKTESKADDLDMGRDE